MRFVKFWGIGSLQKIIHRLLNKTVITKSIVVDEGRRNVNRILLRLYEK